MIYKVRVTPNAKKQSVELVDDVIKVKVNSVPDGGKANREVIEVLAKHFGVSRGRIRVVSGLASRDKKIEVLDIE